MLFECPIISWLLKNHIRVELVEEGFRVYGFYKSDSLLLIPASDIPEKKQDKSWPFLYLAVDRYGDEEEIRETSDLLSLNLKWWDITCERMDGYISPDTKWKPLLVEAGMLEVETETKVKYTIPKRK